MEEVIEGAVRGVGIGFLKLITLGRYRSSRGALVAEGGTGLLVIAAVKWLSYRLLA